MANFFSTIKDYDLFGVNLSFVYLKKEKHGSFFGFFLSLILTIIIAYKFALYLTKIITKEDPDYKMQEVPLELDIIQLKNFSINICPIITYDNSDDNISNKFINYNLELTDMTDYHEKIITHDNNFLNSNLNFSCLIVTPENDNLNITSSNNVIIDKSIILNIDINVTFIKNYYKDNKNDLDIDEEDITTFFIFFEKTYVNASDYYNYFKSTKNYIYLNATEGKSVSIIQYVDKLRVEFVDDIFTFGLFEPNKTGYNNYTFSAREIFGYEYNKDLANFEIVFKHSKTMKLYIITSFSIENLISQFGGYIQIISFLFFKIGETYNHWNLNKIIKFRFMKNLNNNDLNKIDFLIHRKIEDKAYITNSKKNKIMNFSINKPKNTNIQMNEFINENDISNRTINLKQKQENLNHNLSNQDLDHFVNSFYSLFDYEYIYTLIKELKILKYLVLNDRNREFIDLIREFPINVDKFENNKIDHQSNNQDQTTDHLLLSIKNLLK